MLKQTVNVARAHDHDRVFLANLILQQVRYLIVFGHVTCMRADLGCELTPLLSFSLAA